MKTAALVFASFGWALSACAASTSNVGSPPAPSRSDSAPNGPVDGGGALPSGNMGAALADGAPVAFRADLTAAELGRPWNVFGAATGNREVKSGPDGLWLRIGDAERAWDAVGVRTATIEVDGNFDLRGRFRDFGGRGDVSAKLVVVDAKSPRGEAAYVERIQIGGKNLFKFGGEVDGSLESWGLTPSDATAADLRIVRTAGKLHAYTRPDENASWTEFAPAENVPPSMPRLVKMGFKLSAQTHGSAQVRWVDMTISGNLIRKPE